MTLSVIRKRMMNKSFRQGNALSYDLFNIFLEMISTEKVYNNGVVRNITGLIVFVGLLCPFLVIFWKGTFLRSPLVDARQFE